MPAESAADRASFVETDEFGVAATLTPDGGAAVSIDGIFDGPFDAEPAGDVSVGASTPAFLCRTADLPSGTDNAAAIVISGVTYRVAEIRDDGTGMTELALERAD